MPVARETMLHRMHDIWMCSNNDMCFMVRSMLKNLAESAASSRKLGLTFLRTLSVYAVDKSTALRDPQVLTCDKCWQIPAAAATPHLDAHFADGAIADNTCR